MPDSSGEPLLSISKPFKGAGKADYYLNLAQEDYYLAGKEPPGFWLGEAAAELGLSGPVLGDDFRNLLGGFSADRSTPLVHNAGSLKRRSGWDLTWSVPKSVSVAWSQATPQVRAAIEHEVRQAVRRAIKYLEGVGVVSRRGIDGVVRETAKLVFAAFEHSTSRAQDPQLHVHIILINVGIRPDGSTGTLDPRALYRHQLAAGALFRAELAARLERSLGLRARREGRCFELIGVPAALIDEFSKRRAQIEARLQELGLHTAAAAEKAALDTRPEKDPLSRDELLPGWQQVGRAFHWSSKELSFLLHSPFPPRHATVELAQTSQAALQALTLTDSHFTARHLIQALAEEAQGRGLDADAILQLQTQLLTSQCVVPLQSISDERHWTTPEMLAMEKHVLRVAEAMRRAERFLPAAQLILAEVLRDYSHLSQEQRYALRHVTAAEGGIRVVSGLAGTGKSTLFEAAREVWLKQGRQVHGACLAAKAARELAETTRIPAQTIHRTLHELNRGWLHLHAKSLLLVDEAAMVGTRQMKVIFDHCQKAGATLVLCGDVRQLQSIEAGGVFRELCDRFCTAALQEIKRQREEWARKAVKAIAQGRVAEALQEFAGRGLVSLSGQPNEAIQQLVADWKKEALAAPASCAILASRNSDVSAINEAAQRERILAGHMRGYGVAVGNTTVYQGDRIVFTKNHSALGVCNGQMATVVETAEDRITAHLDFGQDISFAPRFYPYVQLAYALTTHKAQGLTVERTFVYVDETAENREAAYVQASRARGLCSFYAVGESVEEIVPSMTRSRPKILATSLVPAPQPGPALNLRLSC